MPIYRVQVSVELTTDREVFVAADDPKDINKLSSVDLLAAALGMEDPDDISINDVFDCCSSGDMDVSFYVASKPVKDPAYTIKYNDVVGIVNGELAEYSVYTEAREENKVDPMTLPFPGQLGIPGVKEDVPK
jgi:hypothetical protein